MSFSDLVELAGKIDYLKVDVEGGEFWFLVPMQAVRARLSYVHYLDIDVHPPTNEGYFDRAYFDENNLWYSKASNAEWELVDFLDSCGFSLEKDKLGYYGMNKLAR